MIFGSRYNIKKSNDIDISIRDEILQLVPSYKYLGIHLDQTLSFNHHMKKVINTISHKLYIFSKIRRYLNDFSALTVYKTMILPYFDYGDVIYMFSNVSLLNKMDRLHKRGLNISLRLYNPINDIDLYNCCKI